LWNQTIYEKYIYIVLRPVGTWPDLAKFRLKGRLQTGLKSIQKLFSTKAYQIRHKKWRGIIVCLEKNNLKIT
jgi:hypothetical protein